MSCLFSSSSLVGGSALLRLALAAAVLGLLWLTVHWAVVLP